MSMAYVRQNYGVPCRRGARVIDEHGRSGVVTSATHYVYVRLDGWKHSLPFHPDSLKWLDNQEEPTK